VLGRHAADINSRDTQPLCDGGWAGTGVPNESLQYRLLRCRTLVGNLPSLSLTNASVRDFDQLAEFLKVELRYAVLGQNVRRLFH
jgi:hypothetical protein